KAASSASGSAEKSRASYPTTPTGPVYIRSAHFKVVILSPGRGAIRLLDSPVPKRRSWPPALHSAPAAGAWLAASPDQAPPVEDSATSPSRVGDPSTAAGTLDSHRGMRYPELRYRRRSDQPSPTPPKIPEH